MWEYDYRRRETAIMSVLVLRWIARLSGLLIAGGYFLMVVGEFTNPHSGPPSTFVEWTGIVLLTATCAGMLVAWRWELPGAILSLASLAAFTAVVHFRQHTVHLVLAVPGLLFLADWLLRRRHTQTPLAGN
jgi:hypothetical protein